MSKQPQLFSMSQIARDLGLHRQTVTKRLKMVEPCGYLKGLPAYTMKKAIECCTKLDSDPSRLGALIDKYQGDFPGHNFCLTVNSDRDVRLTLKTPDGNESVIGGSVDDINQIYGKLSGARKR